MPTQIGPTELIIVLVIVLLILGPKRLPGLGRQLGSGFREFKSSVTGADRDQERDAFGRVSSSDRASTVSRAPASSESAEVDAGRVREGEVLDGEALPEQR